MDTRASTRTRLSVLPVFIALLFNVVAPVVSIAVPDAVPDALQPASVEASDDAATGTQFRLEGCRLEAGDFIEATTTCTDPGYTPGNLGKEWAELDLVPYRLTIGSPVAQSFTIAVAADHKYFDSGSGFLGYDVIDGFVLNTTHSAGSCSIAKVGGNQISGDNAAGGIDETIYQFVTITAGANATCVFDLYMRLALGSHSFSGASLHGYLLEHDLDSLGQRRVSIFVKEIAPQELAKTMTATRGSAFGWSISKTSNPASLNFANTCVPDAASRQATVSVTVSWTRSGPTGSGDVTVTTEITATNPAERSIFVSVEDRIYEGTGQAAADQFGDAFMASTTIAANSSHTWTHTVTGPSDASHFNDVATATYTDVLTGVAVPGNTTATAEADVTLSTGSAEHASVVITDTEAITGSGLTFSVDSSSGAAGTFTTSGGAAYTLGTATTGPVNWTSGAQTASGSVTFNKTVYAVQGTTTSAGSLSDTANVVSGGESITSANLDVAITSDAAVSLAINKTIPAGSLRSGESATFNFEVYAGEEATGTPAATAQITIAHPDLSGSTTVSGLEPGTYTVHEVSQPNWAEHLDQTETILLPDCEGSVSFDNSTLVPNLSITKEAASDPVVAGDSIGFEIVIANSGAAGTGIARDVELTDELPSGDGIDWEITSVTGTGGFSAAADACGISGNSGSQELACDFGDLDPGEGAKVAISSDTTSESCKEYENTAWLHASNADSISSTDSTTVLCPDLELVKDGSEPVSAGDDVQFKLTVTNHGGGAAKDVVLIDNLPGTGLDTWSVVGTENIDASDCAIVADVLMCSVDELASGAWFSVTVEATTDAVACPSIVNDASVSANNEPENDQFPNDDSFTIAVNCPDVTIDKEPIETPISAGEQGQFSITVWNVGPGTAYDVEVVDTAPAGTVWTVLDDDGFDCSSLVSSGQQTLTCTLDELAAGETNARTILIGYTTSAADCGELENSVGVSASNEAAEDTLNNDDGASIIVECPGLNLVKTADVDPIDAGEEASFTLTIWNTGPGTAFDVEFEDDLPDGLDWSFEFLDGFEPVSCESSADETGTLAISCLLGDLADEEQVRIRIFADTDRADCGVLDNLAWAEASNNERVQDDATIDVKCPTIALEKENDAAGSVLPGTTVTYTLTLTVDDGPASGVEVVDALPDGLEDPTSISDGGLFDATTDTITWSLGDLADGEYTLTYQATVADDAANGEQLVNAAAATSPNSQCPDLDTLETECEDTSTVVVRVPTLVLDKVADADLITITLDGDGDIDSVDPEAVTWTLTYTLADGPVTNAVISDELPAGLVYVDGSASDGGVFDATTNSLTWTFATLSASGSVTFQTEVDPETISRVGPTVNVAVISSDQTAEDEGEDQVTVTVEQELGGNPTPPPTPNLPDTAVGIGPAGEPFTVPVELLAAAFITSLGALALANVRASRGRRR